MSGNESLAGDGQDPALGSRFAGGGGIGVTNAELTVNNCTVVANRSVAGGDMSGQGGFGTGGGIDVLSSTANVTNSTIAGNEAVGGAGLFGRNRGRRGPQGSRREPDRR